MSPDMTFRDPHLSELYKQIVPIKEHARQVTGELSTEQMKWRPAAKSWSVGECLEHLIISADLYYDRIEPLLENAQRTDTPQPWRSSVMGRLLIKSVTTSRRLKQPKRFRPPPEPRTDLLDAFLKSQDRLSELIRKADGVNLTKTRLSSPVSRVFRLNLGDCFAVLVLHAKRHLRQAARVAESRRLPKADDE
jgi:hypothetical protein